MKRTKNENDTRPGVQTFVKTGGGFLTLFINGKKRVIVPNQRFRALLEEIPPTHRDTVELVSGDPLPTEPIPVAEDVKPLEYSAKHRGAGWYDIVDSNDKVVNEKALKKKDVEEQIALLKQQ